MPIAHAEEVRYHAVARAALHVRVHGLFADAENRVGTAWLVGCWRWGGVVLAQVLEDAPFVL